MPTWTQDQLNAMGALLAGTHDRLDPTPQIQPAYNVNDLYKGILPAASAPVAMANAPRQPSLTPSQLAAIRDVPSGSYQYPAVQLPNEPRGFSNPNTGSYGRASGAMLQPLDIRYPTPPAAGPPPSLPSIPLPRPRPAYPAGPVPEDALIAGGIKPGIPMAQQRANPGWLQTARQLAQVGFRQGAIQAANKRAPAPALPNPTLNITVPGGRPAAPTPAQLPPIPMARRTPVQIAQMGGLSAAQAYDQANRNAQLAAIQRAQAAQASGARTPVQQLQSQGMSAAQAYAQANALAAARAQASAPNASHQSSGGGGDWFTSARGW